MTEDELAKLDALAEARRLKTAASSKRYRQNNYEKLRQYRSNWTREWRRNNPEAAREKARRYSKPYSALSPERRKKQSAAIAAWRERNPLKTKAHRAVFVALRNGTLKKEPCWCGEIKAQAHHYDYSKPLEVEWLCKKHHAIADIQTRLAAIHTL